MAVKPVPALKEQGADAVIGLWSAHLIEQALALKEIEQRLLQQSAIVARQF